MHTNNFLLIKQNGEFSFQELVTDSFVLTPNKKDSLEYIFVIFNNRLNVEVNLLNEEVEALIKVLYLASENKKIDIQIKANHLAEKTKSSQIIKGILTDQSQVHFHGNIHISKNGQYSDGYQNHRALLLSERAMVSSVPELEIYADDVKCAHGSATGPLEKEALFYLMSRGINRKEAERILIQSFLNDILPEQYHFIIDEWVANHV